MKIDKEKLKREWDDYVHLAEVGRHEAFEWFFEKIELAYKAGIGQGFKEVYEDLLFRAGEFEKRTDDTAEEYKKYAAKLRIYAGERLEFLKKQLGENS